MNINNGVAKKQSCHYQHYHKGHPHIDIIRSEPLYYETNHYRGDQSLPYSYYF